MDIQKYATLSDDGKISYNTEEFAKDFQSEIDSRIGKAIETFKKGSMRDEIRKELEEEAKLSADEKLKKEREEFEAYRKAEKLNLSKAKVKSILSEDKFSKEEIEILLGEVTDDENASIEKANKLLEARVKMLEEIKKKAIEDLQANQPKAGSSSNAGGGDDDQAKVAKRTAEDIKNRYK